jgi:hypothetical protein
MLDVILQGQKLTPEQLAALHKENPAILELSDNQAASILAACDLALRPPESGGVYEVCVNDSHEKMWAHWNGQTWRKALVNLGIIQRVPHLDVAWFGRRYTGQE